MPLGFFSGITAAAGNAQRTGAGTRARSNAALSRWASNPRRFSLGRGGGASDFGGGGQLGSGRGGRSVSGGVKTRPAIHLGRRGGGSSDAGSENQRRAEQGLGFARQQFGNVSSAGAGLSGLAGNFSSDFNSNFRPLLGRIARNAERPIQELVDRSAVDTGLSFDEAHESMVRGLSRMGVDPGSPRFAGLAQKWGLARAAAEAGAKNRARRQGATENFNRMTTAAGLGLNLAGRATSALSGAASASSAAARGELAVSSEFDRLAEEEAFANELKSLFS